MKFQIGDLFIYTSELNRQYGIVTGYGQKNIWNFDERDLRIEKEDTDTLKIGCTIKGKDTDTLKIRWTDGNGSSWSGEHDVACLERTLNNPDFGWKHYPVKEDGNGK